MHAPASAEIRAVRSPDDLVAVAALLVAYAAALDVDLRFQGFDAELASLPGAYVAPRGGLWLAIDRSEAVGCVALRPLDATCAEIKRLYVRPDRRVGGLGRALALHAIEAARRTGYERVRLDTLPSMTGAIALYRSLGFSGIGAYNDNPVPGALFMERTLG